MSASRWCSGLGWIAAALLALWLSSSQPPLGTYLLASVMGALGAVFSVISRAGSLELKPCDDTRMNKLVSALRVGVGGLAGPLLLLLVTTVFAANVRPLGLDLTSGTSELAKLLPLVALVGLVGGFAERMVPDLVASAAKKVGTVAGTPVQATTKA